jgi:hypothetical protein
MIEFLNKNSRMDELYETKAAIASGLAEVVSYIAASGENPDNLLNDIIKLARILDIAAPAARTTPMTILDPRYNLLDYIKRHAGSLTVKEIHGDEILFEKDRPFTCISQVQEIFQDVSEKLNRNFANDNVAKQAEYA